jgi:hypothetical protein
VENPTLSVYLSPVVLPTLRPRRARIGAATRRLRFFLLERLVVPLAAFPFRLLVATWRLRAEPAALIERLGSEPRLVVATYHGMLLQLVAEPPET